MTDVVDVKVEKEKKKRIKKPPFSWKVFMVMIVLVLALGAVFYFWNEAQEARDATPEAVAARNQEESVRIIASLNTILLTESDEQPTVARIEDPTILQQANEDFYKNAQAGDYLVLFPNRAIIFRESEGRVINVAPIINTANIIPEVAPEN